MSPNGPLRILVINLHSSRNAGDAALLEMTLSELRSAFSGPQVTLAMNEVNTSYQERDPGQVRVVPSFASLCKAYAVGSSGLRQAGATARVLAAALPAAVWYRVQGQLPSWLPSDTRDLLAAYVTADLVVGCPGNVFASIGRIGKPFLFSALAVAYALMLRKPLYVLPQSIGPFRADWQRGVLRQLYSRARLICVREPVSLRLARALGLPETRLRLVPDLAFALPQSPTEEAQRFLDSLGVPVHGPRLGVTVINRLLRYVDEATWDQYESVLACVLTAHLRQHGGSVIFFPQVTGPSEREDDRNAARRIVAAMGNPEQAIVVEEPLPPAMLKALYGLMDAVIGTRMHSVIFATSMNVPTLLIEYLSKTRGLAEMLGLEEWCLELTQLNRNVLEDMLERLWQERSILRQALAGTVPALCADAGLAGAAVARDYYGR